MGQGRDRKVTAEDSSSSSGSNVVLVTSPDMGVMASQSPAFRLACGEARWHLQCADKTARVSLADAILGQKYKVRATEEEPSVFSLFSSHHLQHRVFGQSIAYLAERDGDAVPEIIRQCARELRKRTFEEGVFRIPGRGQLIDNVVKSVNMGLRVEIGDFHVHDVAGIFKVRKKWNCFRVCSSIRACRFGFASCPALSFRGRCCRTFWPPQPLTTPRSGRRPSRWSCLFFFQTSILTDE